VLEHALAVDVEERPAGSTAKRLTSRSDADFPDRGAGQRGHTDTVQVLVLGGRLWAVRDAQSPPNHGHRPEPLVDLELDLSTQVTFFEHPVEQGAEPPPPGKVDD
jgi:hypothetical protein